MFGVLFSVAIMLTLLTRIMIMMLRDFSAVMMQFKPPERLMRMPYCKEQCDK